MYSSTSPVDIRPDHLETVQNILREHLPVDIKVWVFGSRANWTTKDSSDLDLAVEGATSLDHRAMVGLEVAFEESDLPFTVDVVDLNAVSHAFKQIVKEQRVALPSVRTPGRVDSAWREVTLGEVAELNGATYSPSDGWPFINYLDTGNITENRISAIQQLVAGIDKIPSRARRKVKSGDIVYSTVRPNQKHFGLLKNIPDHFLASTGFAVMMGRDGIADTGFLYWFLAQDHIVDYLHSIAENSTSAYPSIRPNDLEQLTLSLPPLPEQRAIAHVLGTLDDKIELNRRMNETLEAMARALFKSWFVDFEPVRAKMEGRWRRGESLPGLPAEHYDLFPDHLVDSELGEVPEGWAVKTLGDVVKLNPREPMKRGTIAPYIEMAALPISGPCPDEAVLRKFTSGTRFRNTDTLLARITPCLENGKTAFVQSLPEDTVGWGSTEFIVMRAMPPVPPEYPYLLGRDVDFREHAIQSMTGTSGRQRVQVDALAPYLLPFPPADVWATFSLLVSPMFADIEITRKESHSLAAQRDALLPGLVSGEVRVGRLEEWT